MILSMLATSICSQGCFFAVMILLLTHLFLTIFTNKILTFPRNPRITPKTKKESRKSWNNFLLGITLPEIKAKGLLRMEKLRRKILINLTISVFLTKSLIFVEMTPTSKTMIHLKTNQRSLTFWGKKQPKEIRIFR